jgi:hypothetical protein
MFAKKHPPVLLTPFIPLLLNLISCLHLLTPSIPLSTWRGGGTHNPNKHFIQKVRKSNHKMALIDVAE